MRVLVACEYSGRVRDAFIALGHDAISCDLLPTDRPGPHYQGDVFDIINNGYDLMIAHPPCTYLCLSGVRWLEGNDERQTNMREGAVFFRDLWEADIPRIAVENPVMHQYAKRIVGVGHQQVVQPWMFGHVEKKGTALWLKNLPTLVPTNNVKHLLGDKSQRIASVGEQKNRWKIRSETYEGIAQAMAEQWGPLKPL